jgi:hypothetical protein
MHGYGATVTDATDGFPRIGAPATRVLSAVGFISLDQLAAVSRRELAKLDGIGPKALGLLQSVLELRGKSLSDWHRSPR